MRAISRRMLLPTAAIALFAIMEATMLISVHRESQTSDEAYSLFAGYSHLKAGNFFICPAYPPLAKDVAALPLLAMNPAVPEMTPSQITDFRSGRIFLYSNNADKLLFAARSTMTVFPLLLAVVIFAATWEMFGPGPAIIALALFTFEPNFLAHGPLVTNDVALACCLFTAVYTFWRYAINPTIWRLVVCGLAVGLTLASKHSGIIVFGILLLLAMLELLIRTDGHRSNAQKGDETQSVTARAGRLILALTGITGISVAVLWGFYGFRYSPLAGVPPPSLAPILDALPNRHIAATIAGATRIHLLPEAFLDGLAFFFNTATRPTYLLGVRYVHGVWFYFPTAMVIKSTLGFLLLLALAPFVRELRSRGMRREVLWMVIPAAVFLAASMTSNLNIGIRHVLPIYPFLIILAALGAWSLATRHRAWTIAVAGVLLLHVVSSLRAFPNYIPYSNELWGGPSRTYKVLTDSNVDWGQGLLQVKRYVAEHPGSPCWLAYFGSVDPAYYGIPCKLLPVHTAVIWERVLDEIPPEVEGAVLISATELSGQLWGPADLNPYEQFREAQPADCVAGSILVYRGRYSIPLASGLSMLEKAVDLARHGQLDAALEKAHTAEALAPQSVDVYFVTGRILKAMGRSVEAQQALAKALRLTQTIHPEAQTNWVPIIQNEMRNN